MAEKKKRKIGQVSPDMQRGGELATGRVSKRSKGESLTEALPLAAAAAMAPGAAAFIGGAPSRMTDPNAGAKQPGGVSENGINIGDPAQGSQMFIPWFAMPEEGGAEAGFSDMKPDEQKRLLLAAGYDDAMAQQVIDAFDEYQTSDEFAPQFISNKLLPLIKSNTQEAAISKVAGPKPAEGGTAKQAEVPFPPISPMAMQMFYKETVAPYLQLAGMMNNNAIDQYKSSMGQAMSIPGMKESQAAQAIQAQVPTQVFGAELLNNSLMASAMAAPAADMFQKNLNVAWQQGLSNLNAYLGALGTYSQAQNSGGGSFADMLLGGGQQQSASPTANTAGIMSNALSNAASIANYPTVPAAG